MVWLGKKLIVPILAIIAVLAMAFAVLQIVPNSPLAFGSRSETTNTQIISSITREEQVSLLSLGIQGITEKTSNSTFFGKEVPGSQRATFLQYSFNAKLGIDGKDVRIEPVGEKKYRLSLPKFIFIGHSNEEFQLVAEDNGALSFATPENDPVEMINSILSDEAQATYIEKNEELLKDQAIMFYSGIITAIDPEIEITYDFSQ